MWVGWGVVVAAECWVSEGGGFCVGMSGYVGGCWMWVDGRPCSWGLKWAGVE